MHFRLVVSTIVFLSYPGLASAEYKNNTDSQFNSLLTGYIMAFDYMDLTRALNETGLSGQEHGGLDWFRHDRVGLRLQLRFNVSVSETVSVDSSVNFEYDAGRAERGPGSSLDDGFDVYVKEGFISIRRAASFLDLKVGRQFVFWSRFEWGGALDVVSPWDYSNMGAEKENYRLPVDGLSIASDVWRLRFEGLLLPYFQPSRIPLALPATVGPFPVVQNATVRPDMTWDNSEWGARLLVQTSAQSEVGFTFFRGFDRSFSMLVEPLMDEGSMFPSAIAYTPVYNRSTVFGLDGEFGVGPMLVVAEAGLLLGEDETGADVFLKNDQIKAVAGLEWEIVPDLVLQAQGSWTHLLDYDRQREYDNRKALGEPDPYVAGPNQFGASYKLQWKFHDEMAVHILNMYNVPDSQTFDMMLLGFLVWEPYEAMKIYGGVVMFYGAEPTTFGRLEEQSRLFFEIRQFF